MLRRYKKGIALLLLLTFAQEIFVPSTLWALTGGPSQPEVNSFEPIGTNQMVDLATGDFTYNIPLMVVPGPNGSYPINLAYHAGAGMEQEASWVGLGWNINPGAITRNLRGVPDDFSGDEIVKKTNLKPNITAGLSLHMDQVVDASEEKEIFGYKSKESVVKSSSLKVYFNNYKGVGFTAVMSPIQLLHKEATCGYKFDQFFDLSAVFSFDSNSGIGMDLTPSLSRDYRRQEHNWQSSGFSVGLGLNSRQGLNSIRFATNRENNKKSTSSGNFSSGTNISFANQTYVPSTNNNMSGSNILLGLTIRDKDQFKVLRKNKTIRGELSIQKLTNNELSYASFGSFYLENEIDSKGGRRYNSIMDFNVYNDIAINKRSVFMGLPTTTADLFVATGHGMSGVFQIHRNDIATVYNSGNISNTVQGSGSTEFGAGSYTPNPIDNPTDVLLGGTNANVFSIGVDLNGGFHHSYSGKWNNKYYTKVKIIEAIHKITEELEGISDDLIPIVSLIWKYEDITDLDDIISAIIDLELVETIEEELVILLESLLTENYDALGKKFSSPSTEKPLIEKPYFKFYGEKTSCTSDAMDYLTNEKPIAFDIVMEFRGKSPQPFTMGKVIGGKKLENRNQNSRVKRLKNIEYRKKGEIINHQNYANRSAHIYNAGQIPIINDGVQIDYNAIDGTVENVDHHIQSYSILREDGSRYVYGLPAYNTYYEENVFANRSGAIADEIDEYEDADIVTYSVADADITNDEGVDHYFSSTEIPPYAHSNMLTEITSSDYIDITGDGLSEDDFGFYAKFNYTQVNDYKWRDPFYGADYIKGYYSNELDDKATFSYGSKNLSYLHSIETKTHVAVFELGDRADGIGVNNDSPDYGRHQEEGEILTGKKQKYLKSIKLYSKIALEADGIMAEPLQTITFIYSYELCQGVFNNDGDIDDPDHFITEIGGEPIPQNGKLTLKKVMISYNENEKGRLTPYEFNYAFNPDYSRLNIDRWGNYQDVEGADPYENVVNPYTQQDDIAEVDLHASAWNMTQINLPSGGVINIDYESDNYGYVQDHRAAQMVEIVGFTEKNVDTWTGGEDIYKLKKKNLRIWFKADKLEGVSIPNRDEVIADYIEGIDDLYFKVFENLKLQYDLSKDAEDYVVGYAEIDHSGSYGADEGGQLYGYIDLKEADYTSAAALTFQTHPFRKAGWQYLRYLRSDLFNDQGTYNDFSEGFEDALLSIPLTLSTVLKDALSIISLGEYNQFRILGYCKNLSTRKKSFIRLNSPNKFKLGGGHRVASVTLGDNWVEGGRTFGTIYSYENQDGTTSGVADYEPIIGGEENALKKPLRFNGNGQLINFQDQDVYIEEPISEGVYPGAKVQYGRVVSKGLDNTSEELNIDDVQLAITVNEYYTAKEFPVITDYTDLEQDGHTIPLYIPYLGFQTVNNRGYSQGYTVILNDMSGKPKRIATYPYRDGDIQGLPISEVKYKYKTDMNGRLNNEVVVLDSHGEQRTALVGVEQDITIFEEEHRGYSESLGEESGMHFKSLTVPYAPGIIPMFMADFKLTADHSESMYRGISTSKIIRKSGILEEVEVTSDGSKITTKNILFDAETGDVLLTSVNNEWDKPVYNYNYAAHWNYDGMGGAYKNYRANVYFEGTSGSLTLYTGEDGDLIPASEVLIPGDEITINDEGVFKTYYVTTITGDNFDLQSSNGYSFPSTAGTEGVITRSGYRNLQSVKSGSVVALSTDFLYATSDLSQQFIAWNTNVTGADPQSGIGFPDNNAPYINLNTGLTDYYNWDQEATFVPNVYNCLTGDYWNFRIFFVSPSEFENNILTFDSQNCTARLTFIDEAGPDTPIEKGDMFPVLIEGIPYYGEQLVNFKIISETKDEDGNIITVNLQNIISGNVYTATWEETSGSCWEDCVVSDILHSDAIVFSDDWEDSYPYSDVGDPEVSAGVGISTPTLNEYRYGKKGVWRAKQTYLYQIPRKQSGSHASETKINIDGEYEPWEPYSWLPGRLNPKWDWVSEITRYSPYGYAIEERSRLNSVEDDLSTEVSENSIYSSQMYGYDNSMVIATSALSSYFEIGFTGFEQGDVDIEEPNNTGHISLSSDGTYNVVDDYAHTGTNSLKVINDETISFTADVLTSAPDVLSAIEGKKYIVSLWVNVEEPESFGSLTVGSETVTTATTNEIIDGWKKLEISFVMGGSETIISYESSGITYIDDIRFSPYDGGMMTYVYSRNNLWLMAELDALNYATFYNYDEEGNLVQVKKETENGIVTVQTSRSNTIQK